MVDADSQAVEGCGDEPSVIDQVAHVLGLVFIRPLHRARNRVDCDGSQRRVALGPKPISNGCDEQFRVLWSMAEVGRYGNDAERHALILDAVVTAHGNHPSLEALDALRRDVDDSTLE